MNTPPILNRYLYKKAKDSDGNLESDDDEKVICMGGGGRGMTSKETQNSSSIIDKIDIDEFNKTSSSKKNLKNGKRFKE